MYKIFNLCLTFMDTCWQYKILTGVTAYSTATARVLTDHSLQSFTQPAAIERL